MQKQALPNLLRAVQEMQETKLAINFIAAQDEVHDFVIYRQKAASNAKPLEAKLQRYRMPTSLNEWEDYWVSYSPRSGFDAYTTQATLNPGLTNWILSRSLELKCSTIGPIRSFGRGFSREIALETKKHKEGAEEIVLQPYFLKHGGKFGFLVDFHFRPEKAEPFSRRILQLSLSLDSQNRRNANFYTDKRSKIASFLKAHFNDLFPLALPGQASPTEFHRNFFPLTSQLLPRKRYIVGNGDEKSGPFVGVRESGPWQGIQSCPPLVFIFREQERESARYLVRALKGTISALNFEGFEKMFKVPLEVSHQPVILTDFTQPEMERAVKVILDLNTDVLPVLVLPRDAEEAAYATHKAMFASKGIPTQVCTTSTIADNYTLKWSIANLALQLFCKAGGKPWKVKSTDEHCLIIGIGQAHRYKLEGAIKKVQRYFAFSILTDSSGLFQSVEMLGESETETHYLDQLQKNLAKLLTAQAANFTKVVLHTPFKLKQTEMHVLEEEVRKAAGAASACKFAVVKVNQHNRFFAFNEAVNSLIPYEGTYAQLAADEFLIWFEGLFPDKPTASKAVPGPTHLKFMRVSDPSLIGDKAILQDLLNLSGANWRGFNAKSTPVSVLYCYLVAEMLSNFQELGLPMPAIHDINPWFL